MEGLIALVVLLLVGTVLVLPIVALVIAVRARREAGELRDELHRVERRLASEIRKPAAAPATAPASAAVAEPVAAAAPEPAAAPPPVAAPAPAAERPIESVLVPPLRPPPPAPAEPRPTIEQQIGLTWFTRIGAGAFVLGVLYFFKYAIDNEWIGPFGRVAIGAAAGIALLVAGERLSASVKPAYAQALTGLGLAALLISSYASAALYHLVPVAAAFAANAVILFLGVALARRYRAEAILIFVLAAGFLNPVFLSTGEDRPLALFSYLLLLTGAALAVAVPLGFRIVPWLAMAGTAAIFGGWYERFFDFHAPPGEPYADLPPDELAGAYHALTSRIVPLLFVALFSAQWIAAVFFQRARAADSRMPRAAGGAPVTASAYVVAALVLAHAGAALLLPDSPRVLALAMIALGGASAFLMRKLEAADWLFAPMLAAFVALLAVSGGVPQGDRQLLVLILGAWTAVYLFAFLRAAAAGAAVQITRGVALRVAAGALLFTVLVAVLFVPHDLTLFALVLALVSAGVAYVAIRGGVAELMLGALGLSALALGAASPLLLREASAPSADALFLAAAAVWALVYAAAAAYELLVAAGPPAWMPVLTASAAGLGFLAVAIASTRADVPTLRALLAAAVGALDLTLGALLLRRRPEAHEKAAVLAAESLGLFAAAIAFALSGAVVSVLWAALGAVAGAIAARSSERAWLVAAGALFAAAIVRALAVDVPGASEQVRLFFDTYGRDGVYALPVLLNERALALTGTGAALLVAARLLARSGEREFRIGAGAGATVGYAFLLVVAIVEVRAAFTVLPPPPPVPLDAEEWSFFVSQHAQAFAEQRGSLDMVTTLVMGLFAAALVTAGFAARSAFHRWLGLALLALTVLKLAFRDVWQLERIYQIAVLTGVGALLLMAAFLYARFGPRLLALVRDGAPPAAALLLALGAGAAEAQPARPLAVSPYASVRALTGVDAPGDFRFEVDEALYRASTAVDLLADVRIAGPDGAEVPYVVREIDAPRSAEAVEAELLDPTLALDGAAYATWEVAGAHKHCRVALSLSGDGFLRKVRVETGDDRAKLGVVAEGGFVYRIFDTVRAEELIVRYPVSSARYLRVTLLPDPGGPEVRIAGGTLSCLAPDAEPPMRLFPLKIEESRFDAEKKQTLVTLDAGAEGLPLQALLLHIDTPEFQRRVSVEASSHRAAWPPAGAAVLYRVRPRLGFTLSQERVPVGPVRKRWLRVRVEDGDDAPLQIAAVEGEVRAREIVFRAAAAGEHRLYVGDKKGLAPGYDLSAVLARADREIAPRDARLGSLEANPRFGAEEAPPHLPFTERYRRVIGGGLALLLVALSFWAIRLLRSSPPAA